MDIIPANPLVHYDRCAEIITYYDFEPVTADDIREWDARKAEKRFVARYIVINDEQIVLAYGAVIREAWDIERQRFYLVVQVDPRYKGQGAGRLLADHVQALAHANGAKILITDVKDNDPVSLAFAEKHGYHVNNHIYEASLHLENFDTTQFALIDKLEASGIRFFSLADAGNSEAMLRKLHHVNAKTAENIPGNHTPFMSFEDFKTVTEEASWFNPSSQFLAADGDEVIGLAAVSTNPHNNTMYSLMTGVMPQYRGRKIAQALKLVTIRYALIQQSTIMFTNNHADNAPMIAINRKLGYQPQPGYYQMMKETTA